MINVAQVNYPKVNVIMNCHNSSEFLKEAIDSVYSQTFNDWEIIFWDNGSTDSSASIAQNYDERLRYFYNHTTLPLGEARNKAIAEARGEFIAFLDCDDLWLPAKLEKQLSVFQTNDDIALVYTNTIKFQNDYETVDFKIKSPPPTGYIFKHFLKRDFVTLSSAMCRRKHLLSLKYVFNPIFQIAEDWELWLRLCYYYPAGYVPEPLTKWRINPNSLTHKKFSLYADETRMIIEMLKNFDQDIPSVYKQELEALDKIAIYRQGLGCWFSGDPRQARQIFRPYFTSNLKFFLAYFASFLPPKVKNVLEKLYFRLRIGNLL